jgi:hypothetical protein
MQHHHTISYIEFSVPSVARAKDFYAAVFGWQFTDWGEDYASFESPSVSGGFCTGVAGGEGVLVVLYSSTLEPTLSSVVAHGGQLTREIYSFPGGRRFEFIDPSGNKMAVWSE